MNFLMAGKTPKRGGNAHPNIQPQDVFVCADGQIVLVVGNDRQFAKLCDLLGLSELSADPRFSSNPERVRNQALLRPILDREFLKHTRAHWTERLEQVEVPCGPINTVPEALTDPQIQHRQMVREIPHPVTGPVPQVMTPFHFGSAQIRANQAPPMLGEHTDDILAELGWTADRIAELRKNAVI
jgi:crotonobetainyl-CoA:carnitine CoA-transferase CaiB-like acyl-CoA transferase